MRIPRSFAFSWSRRKYASTPPASLLNLLDSRHGYWSNARVDIHARLDTRPAVGTYGGRSPGRAHAAFAGFRWRSCARTTWPPSLALAHGGRLAAVFFFLRPVANPAAFPRSAAKFTAFFRAALTSRNLCVNRSSRRRRVGCHDNASQLSALAKLGSPWSLVKADELALGWGAPRVLSRRIRAKKSLTSPAPIAEC